MEEFYLHIGIKKDGGALNDTSDTSEDCSNDEEDSKIILSEESYEKKS